MRHRTLIVVLVAMLSMSSGVSAKDIDERNWILIESEHFSVHSSLSEKKTRKLLLHLEALRGVFALGMSNSSRLEEKPTKILVLGKSSDYRKLGLPEQTAGTFIPGLRENYIVVSNSSSMDESRVILHEYVHFISRAAEPFPYPKWWDEGIAEYVSGSKLSKKNFDFGLPQEGRLYDLRNSSWNDWEDVLNASNLVGLNRRQGAIFYAQSWLLVHYLFNRDADPDARNQSWARYLPLLEAGASPASAFAEAFSLDLETMKRDLKKYANGKRFTYSRRPVDLLVPNFSPATRSLEKIEAQLLLGQFSLQAQDADQASIWFSKAIKTDPENARAIAGLGVSLAAQEQVDSAQVQFDRALQLEPDNPDILLDYARFELQLASAPDAWFTQADHLEAAETMLTKARSVVGGTVEIDCYLASIWLAQERGIIPALTLLKTVLHRAPTEQWPLLLFAEGLDQAGQTKDAVAWAEQVIRYDHSASEFSRRAQQLIDKIESSGDNQSGEQGRIGIQPPEVPRPD